MTLLENSQLSSLKDRVCDMSMQLVLIDERCGDLGRTIKVAQHLCYRITSLTLLGKDSVMASVIMAIWEHDILPLAELKQLIIKKFCEASLGDEVLGDMNAETLKAIYTLVANSLIRIDRTTKENFVSWS
jgi:hypothetical protein